MRIFVQVWCEIDPTLNVRIDRGTLIPVADAGDRLRRVSPLGRAGIAAGLPLGGVTAFALGLGHEDALRHALAAGAMRAVTLQPGDTTMSALARWLAEERADLVIADRIAGRLAFRLGWSHLAGLDDLQLRDGMLHAVRYLERGDREVVTARLPAMVRLRTEGIHMPYVSLARLQSAGQRNIEQITLADAGSTPADGSLQLARPRTKKSTQPAVAATASGRLQALMFGSAPVATAKKTEERPATVDQMADEFVRYLLHHELL